MDERRLGEGVTAALVSAGRAGAYWREMAEQMERERNAAFEEIKTLTADLAAARAREAALVAAWDAVLATEPDMWSVRGHPRMRATAGLEAFQDFMKAMHTFRRALAADQPAEEGQTP